MALLKNVNELYAAKGKKVVHVNLKKTELSEDELKKLVLGPTGNLRAPTLRKGKTLMVGSTKRRTRNCLASAEQPGGVARVK